MPTTGETNSGPVEIITYSDQHETDIYNNGNVIARAFTNMIAIEGTHQMDLDTTVYWLCILYTSDCTFTFLNTEPIKVNYIGPFQVLFTPSLTISTDLSFYFFQSPNDATTATNTGFQDQTAEALNFVCWYVDLSTN